MSDATILSFPKIPQDRLRIALRKLEAALAEQAEAVAALRGEIGALKEATQGLQKGFAEYQESLADCAVAVHGAREAQEKIVRTLEGAAA
ncbi:hypothetical protein ACQW02_05635 [Humitalea sp. 24SJ18S-53]|uniref:hypothetical protein n=1 Tax=Humitalea sp. 24SJ18S-53 TaxID=3422307 RepID=UPI003D66DD60